MNICFCECSNIYKKFFRTIVLVFIFFLGRRIIPELMARLEKIDEQESVLIDSRKFSEQTLVRGKALQIVPLP